MMQDHRFSKKHIHGLLLIVAVAAILAVALKGIPNFSIVGTALPTKEFSETAGDSDEVLYVYNLHVRNTSWLPAVVTSVSCDEFHDFYLCPDGGFDGYDGTMAGLGGGFLQAAFWEKYATVLSERCALAVDSSDFVVLCLSDRFISDNCDMDVTIHYRLLNVFPATKTVIYHYEPR
jgi:hypothetical protein